MPEPSDEQPEIYSRAYFLSLVIAFVGGMIGLAFSGLGFGYFFSPAWRKQKEGWVELGPAADLPEGKPLKMDYIIRRQDGWITTEGRASVWLLKEGPLVTAFSPNCTHLGCAYRWDEVKQSFLCPCHTGVFSKTGAVVSGPPPRGLDRFLAKVEAGTVFILPKEKNSVKNRILDWLDDKSGWRKLNEVLLLRKIPKGVNWAYTLGSMLAFTFVVQAVTGMLLAMHYSPSPDHAYQSIQYLSADVPLGAIIRGIHHWAASAMVVLAVIHLLRVFFMAAYKHPRQLTWMTGVGLLLIVIGLGFTGYLLPWDQKAYWATVVGSKIAGTAPIVGTIMGKILKGGEELGAITLTRFYAIHVLVLPALFVVLVAIHLFLVVWHGISAPPEKLDEADLKAPDWKERMDKRYLALKARGVSFFPNIIAKDMVAIAILATVLAWLAVSYGAGLEEMADPTSSDYNPRPEWYFLFIFQALKYFPGSLEAVATMVLPGLAMTLLFLLPFLDGGAARHPTQRKGWVGLGFAGLGMVVFLTVQGLLSPGGNLHLERDPKVIRGRRLFVDLRCASCHSINGHGGVVGPTLDNAASRRGREWIAEHFRKPQRMTPGSAMPNFKLMDDEVDDLTEYIISLEGGPYSKRAPQIYDQYCSECHALDGKKGDDSGPDLDSVGKNREQGWIAEYIRNPDKIYPEAEMPGFTKQLSEAEIEDIARFLTAHKGPRVPAKPKNHTPK